MASIVETTMNLVCHNKLLKIKVNSLELDHLKAQLIEKEDLDSWREFKNIIKEYLKKENIEVKNRPR
jgi:hypothetical protein